MQRRRVARPSLLRQPRLPEAVERGRKIRRVFLQPFNRDCGIEAAGFGEGGLRLVYLASMRVRGRQVRVDVEHLLHARSIAL